MPGFGSIGPWEIILVLAVLLLIFGARRLPEIGSALGRGIREFKSSVRDIEREIKTPERKDLPPANAEPQGSKDRPTEKAGAESQSRGSAE